MKIYWTSFPALFFLLLASPKAVAQEVQLDSILKDHVNFRFVGPYRGGRCTAVTGVTDQTHLFYMGTTGGGVWQTDDAGNTWKNISDGQILCGSIGSISVAPSAAHIIYVGTGSDSPRGNVSAGIGIYKSMNKGKTWIHVGLDECGQIGDIIIHPDNPDIVYVAALGNIFKPNRERGVYKTKDGGDSWTQVLYLSDTVGAIDLALHPENPDVLYAGMWRAERKPWTMIDGGSTGGLYRTKDAGQNWTKVKKGLPTGIIGRIGIDISPINPERIWVIQQAGDEKMGGVYRSDDGGESFKRICRDHKLRQRGWYYSRIFADPSDENTVYVTNTGFYKSIDGGKNFDHRYSVPHGDNHDVWINPTDPKIMINSNDGGANVTLNGGKTWSRQTNQPTPEFYRLTVDNQFPYRLYAGQQDNTTISVPSRPSGGLDSKTNWFDVAGGESADVAVDPRDPNIVYATTYSGIVTKVNVKTDAQRDITLYPHYTEGTEQRDLKYRFQWNFPIRISKHNPDAVYIMSNFVHRTDNAGQEWQTISPDLTQDKDAYQDIPGGPVQHDATGVEVYGSIFSFAESTTDEKTLWAGSDDGRLHITRDGGDNWQEITPDAIPAEGTINDIRLSPHRDGSGYLAIYNYRMGDFRPYIFATEDFGTTWKLLTEDNGIPKNHFVRCVAEDPGREGLLYAGTEYGMYASLNNGQDWQPLQLNLPHTPITDMEVHQGDLVISTQGRGFWILDDLSLLHQLDTKADLTMNHIFEPEATYRSWVARFGNPDAPARSPYHADIHFYFDDPDTSENIRLQIIDKNGDLAHEAASNSKSKVPLMVKKGFNTYHWDLTYSPPTLVKDLVMMDMRFPGKGPKAPTGSYSIRLIAKGDTLVTSLEIKKDPRWQGTSLDHWKTHALNLEVRELITKSQKEIKNLRSIRKQINGIKENLDPKDNQELIDLGKNVIDRNIELEEMIFQTKIESSQDEINYPRKFTNHIIHLYASMIESDDRPTGGILERWADLRQEYVHFDVDYQAFLKDEVPAFIAMLKKMEIPAIIIK